MTRPIVYNLVRLVMGASEPVPRGIDRIDFGLMSHLFEQWPGDCFGLLPTPWGPRLYSRDRILRGCATLASMWREGGDDAQSNAEIDQLPPALSGGGADRSGLAPTGRARWGRVARLLFGEGLALGQPISTLPYGAIHLDVGHLGISFPVINRWLDRRRDLLNVFMIHDVIPLQFPEFVARDSAWMHRNALKSAARWANVVLVPSQASGAAVATELRRLGRDDVDIKVLPLPVDDAFHRGVVPYSELADRPYFVICGAVDRRKNHALLIEVWRRLLERAPERVPTLVIAGSFGRAATSILAELRHNQELARLIVPVPGLATAALARLIAGTRALLMPSLAEGYGLPPVEALSMGTPVVVSDIPAHREAVGDHGLHLGTDDVEAWVEAVEGLGGDTPLWRELTVRARSYVPLRWGGCLTHLERELSALG